MKVSLAWDKSPEAGITNYSIYWGIKSRTYTNSLRVGTNTSATISNLVAGTKYFFTTTATDRTGLESYQSNEATYPVPATNIITVAIQSSGSAMGAWTNYLTATFTNPPAAQRLFRIGISTTNVTSQILRLGNWLQVTNTTN